MILIIDCGSQKTPYIEQAVDLQMDYKTIALQEATSEIAAGMLGIVISGAPILITEVDPAPYLTQLDWLKEIQIPVFGICFGHQILGLLHGASAARQREDRDWQEIEALEEHPLFSKLPTTFEMMEDHCESISVPAHFQLLATSDTCVNEAMYHKEKPLFGVQFHPEVSGNQGTLIIENFVDICRQVSSAVGI
jgi:GMP synthase (glutamine-hydrolysing)